MRVYRKNDKPIEAVKFDGSQTSIFGYKVEPDNGIVDIDGKPVYYTLLLPPMPDSEYPDEYEEIILESGDWVIKDHALSNSDYYYGITTISDDEDFNNTYKVLENIPMVTDWIKECKANHKTLLFALNEKNLPDDVREKLFTDDEWIKMQDEFARMWLLY